MSKKLYVAVISVLIAAFAISAFYLGSYFLEGKKQADRYDELSAIVNEARETAPATEAPTDAPTEAAPAATEPSAETAAPAETTAPTEATAPAETVAPENREMLPGYKEIHDKNPDMVGWIKIEGTEIDYPVMQTAENNRDYYLYRNFDKEDSVRGSIYAREECNLLTPSDNITLYGHNMKDGSMFAGLGDYFDKSFWQDNSLIFFDNLYEYHVYKVFAVFKTTASLNQGFSYHQMVDAADKAAFDKFIKTCKDLSFYDTGITPAYGDKIICLSTCEYTLDNGRFVVAAVRIM